MNLEAVNENYSRVRSAPVSTKSQTQFIALPLRERVADAIARIRASAGRGGIFYLYVVDDIGRLQGIISIRNLLLAKDDQLVGDVHSPKVVALKSSDSLHEAYRLFTSTRFLSLPVLDEQGRLVGVLNAHEVAGGARPLEDNIEDKTRSQIFELLGIQLEDASRNSFSVAFRRFPWLLINIVGGGLCAYFIHGLGGRLDRAVEFLAFVPILLVVSESIGMQSASMVIANLSRSGSGARTRRLFAKDTAIAGILGAGCATLVASVLYFWKGDSVMALAVALTIFLGCLLVSFVGNTIPLLLHRWKLDPRVAAGPVVLSVADCATLLLYLSIALLLAK